MARQRRPVPSLQESLAPRLAPQASPVSLGPTVAPPTDLPIYDFSAISESLAGALRRQQEVRNKATQQKGEQFAEENRLVMADLQEALGAAKDPEERDRIQKEAFAALRKAGEIPDAADINWRIGLERANGRIMVGQYWQNLQRRLADVSTVVDPQTGLPREPLAAEAIMADEWEKIAKSPAVQGYYGGQEALAQKVQADSQFLQAVTNARSKAEAVHYGDVRAREIGQLFDDALANNDVVGSQELKSISAYVHNEARTHNILTPREDVLNAIELSIKRKAAISGSEAIRAVEAAEDIVIGGVRLGDDRSGVGERLQELKRQVRTQAAQADEEELQAENNERKLAIQKAQADYVPKLLAAKREGQSVRKMAQAIEEDYLAREPFGGGREAFAIRSMQEFAQELEGESVTDPAVAHDINRMVAEGRLDEAQTLADSAQKNRALSGTDYGAAIEDIRKRREVSRYMEDDNLYRDTVAGLDQAVPRGFAPEVQDRFEQQGADLKAQFNQNLESFIRSTEGKPNRDALIRQEVTRMGAEYRAKIAEGGKAQREKQNEATRDISQRISRFQDARDLIDQAEAEGALTVAEAEKQRQANLAAATGREELVQIAQQESSLLLDARLQAEFGGPAQDQLQITQQVEAHRRLRDQIGLAIDAMIADPNIDPRAFTSRARAEGNRLVDELGDKLFPDASRERVKGAIERGEAAGETQQQVQRLKADRTLAETIESQLVDPLRREALQASDPIFAPAGEGAVSLRAEGVPDKFYEYAAAWWSGRDPIFGSPVTRATMESQVIELSHSLEESPDRDSILAGALDVVGVDAVQVVRGEAVIETPPGEQEFIRREIDALEAGMAVNLFTRPSTQARIDMLRRRLEPTRVSLKDHEWKAHATAFFRSEEALAAFSNDDAFPDFLRIIGIDPGSQEEIQEWASYQRTAIARTR